MNRLLTQAQFSFKADGGAFRLTGTLKTFEGTPYSVKGDSAKLQLGESSYEYVMDAFFSVHHLCHAIVEGAFLGAEF